MIATGGGPRDGPGVQGSSPALGTVCGQMLFFGVSIEFFNAWSIWYETPSARIKTQTLKIRGSVILGTFSYCTETSKGGLVVWFV